MRIPIPADRETLRKAIEYGGDTSGKYFELTNNISVSTMLGTDENPFAGSFDGGGSTLTAELSSSDPFCAPFCYVSGARIEDLTVDGAVTILDATCIQRFIAGFTD